MTLPEVEELFDYWREHPPTHILVAGYLGYEPPKSVEQQQAEGAMGPADFARHFQATGGKVEGVGPR